MLRRVLRPNLLAAVQPMRGGGGWPRPDVPLLENYEHKRQLSIYDMNVWWYDNVMPEYVVSYQDQHLHDQYQTVRAWGQLFPPLFAAMTAVGLFFYFVNSTRMGGFYLENETEAPYIRQIDRTVKQRLALKRNFLNFDRTGQDGLLHNAVDVAPPAKLMTDQFAKSIRQKKQINLEAKNFVSRIESETREKWANGKPAENHGHH